MILPPTLSPYKNGIEWLKYEFPSDIINFRCLLLKADFRIFYFELETLLNKLVKLCSYFFVKNNFKQECSVLFSSEKSTYFLTGPGLNISGSGLKRVEIDGSGLQMSGSRWDHGLVEPY